MATNAVAVPVRERLTEIWETPPGVLGRLSSVDHKLIGKRYLVTAFAFFIAGGIEAAIMRAQLAGPGRTLVTPEQYNQLFTMHGVSMIFLYALPILSGFSNYLWPLMLGARDMAYPRVNALSYWIFLAAGLFIYSSFLIGQAPDGGWFAYTPLTGHAYSPGLNIDFYALGLIFLGISTTVGAVNFIVTLAKLRAPGMSINRLPIFVWGTITVSVAIVFAIPALTVDLIFLYFDRTFGMHFFDPGAGGQPLLWQHLFWIFGHPWVYIIVLPAMGMVSDILPVFCRRPLVGYTYVALATVSTGIIGFGVWVHHMFATGLPLRSMSFFAAASLVIAIPSAVAVFAWLATIFYGRPWFKTPFLFMAGFIFLFVVGGVSGVMTAAIPFDWQLTDSYFVVAHIHYVLIGINVFPVIGALYFWFPKFTGRMMSETLGKWSFWVMFVGFNVGFFPMHLLGLLGMPRRIYTYQADFGWGPLNLLVTIGAGVFAIGLLLVLINVVYSMVRGVLAGDNPWDAATLEWSTTSPPPVYNFAAIPTIRSRHPLWEDRLGETGRSEIYRGPLLIDGRETLETSPLDARARAVLRMPTDSYWPVVLAASLTVFFYGALTQIWWLTALAGAASLFFCATWLWPVNTRKRVPPGTSENPATDLPVGDPSRTSVGGWGMSLLVLNEAVFFAYLIFSYFYLSSLSQHSWPPGGPPALKLVLPNTVILIASSFTAWWASRGIEANNGKRLRIGLIITIVLGVVFLVIQGFEFASKDFRPNGSAYASSFFTVTGFHGAHVLIGLLILGTILIRAFRGHFRSENHLAVSNAVLYWHFVDVVWLAVLVSLYIVPRLG
ncbi:MAG: cytochrome c oxidase subunit I [Gemmatimonadaceae bacterium]